MALTEPAEPFSWLVLSLPFRFYNWFMLLLVFLVVWFMRDWGPMLTAERKARSSSTSEPVPERPGETSGPVALALVPLAVLVVGVFGGLVVDGGGLEAEFTFASLVSAFGRADAAKVFVLATAAASAVAMAMAALWRGPRAAAEPAHSSRQAFLHGMQQMFLPALILVFAWMLNSVIKELGTAAYLVSLLGERLPPVLLPALVFLLAAVVSFSTGTSWGTMAIVMPLSIPLAAELSGSGEMMGTPAVMAATIGAVLAGAVFGDHCSPISDTTVVSAFSCDCDVMAHVRTQMPYALAAAVLALVLGYGPAGFGVSPWLLLPLGVAALWALVRLVGKPVQV
jgi:Na+/H+ antiporter NhaC